jgi:hypothetical protein
MATLRRQRRSRVRSTVAGLTPGQHAELMFGLVMIGDTGFQNAAEAEAAWWANRTALLAECRPFQRPIAYWEVEVGIRHPTCAANDYKSESDELIQRGLPLTAQEQTLLRAQTRTKEELRQ